jgi:hypothetical protein
MSGLFKLFKVEWGRQRKSCRYFTVIARGSGDAARLSIYTTALPAEDAYGDCWHRRATRFSVRDCHKNKDLAGDRLLRYRVSGTGPAA